MRNLIAVLVLVCSFAFVSEASAQRFGFRRSAYPRVGYQPNITWLPEGTSLTIGAPQVYTYGPRRYVRFGVNYGFYSIPRVNTFQYYNGVRYRRTR